jgi:hypothetical protein
MAMPVVWSAKARRTFLIREERYMHHFDHSQPGVLVVRTYRAASDECYTRTSREPESGL